MYSGNNKMTDLSPSFHIYRGLKMTQSELNDKFVIGVLFFETTCKYWTQNQGTKMYIVWFPKQKYMHIQVV